MAKKEVNKKENIKNKKSFFKDFKAELKRVIWPTPKQLVNGTVAVITIVLITAAIVFVLDLTFETLNKNGVDRIKEIISADKSNNNTNTQQGNTTENNSVDTNQNETNNVTE